MFASACHELSSANNTNVFLYPTVLRLKIIRIINHRQQVSSTSNVLLKNHFGSFEEVLANNKNLLSTSHGAAVKTFLQDFRHSCWLGYRVKEEFIKTLMTSGSGKRKYTGGKSSCVLKVKP